MSTALRKPMSLEEFLAWEETQELRYEFDGWHPVAMTGGTLAHELICGALRAALRDKLRGKPCQAVGPTLKIEVAGKIRYPDAFIYCSAPDPKATVIRGPVVVFEVLSPGTSRTDRYEKLREYQTTPSIQRYVILEQDTMGATSFSREGDAWMARPIFANDTLEIPEASISIPLRDIYADVEVPETSDDAESG